MDRVLYGQGPVWTGSCMDKVLYGQGPAYSKTPVQSGYHTVTTAEWSMGKLDYCNTL